MKKIITCLLILVFSFSLNACSGSGNNNQTAQTMEHSVAYELSKVENADTLDDETLKALSIIIRTELYMYNNNMLSNEDLINTNIDTFSDNTSNFKVNLDNEQLFTNNLDRFTRIANQTKGQILTKNKKPFHGKFGIASKKVENNEYNFSNTDNNNDKNILKIANNITNDNSTNKTNNTFLSSDLKNKEEWQVVIKKSDILSYLNKNNISLASISKINPTFDNNGNLLYLTIAGKEISYFDLKENFALQSAKITDIENKSSVIIIHGTGEDSNDFFDIETASILAKKSYSSEQLLNHFYFDYILKTM